MSAAGDPRPSAAPVTPPDATARMADALADLADTLHGWRDRFDAMVEEDHQEKAERAEEDRKRQPAEWQAALDQLRDWLYGQVHGQVPMGEEDKSKADAMLDGIVAAIDNELRTRYAGGLKYVFDTLSAPPPPVDLKDQAEQAAHSMPTAEARELYSRAWLDGATHEVQ